MSAPPRKSGIFGAAQRRLENRAVREVDPKMWELRSPGWGRQDRPSPTPGGARKFWGRPPVAADTGVSSWIARPATYPRTAANKRCRDIPGPPYRFHRLSWRFPGGAASPRNSNHRTPSTSFGVTTSRPTSSFRKMSLERSGPRSSGGVRDMFSNYGRERRRSAGNHRSEKGTRPARSTMLLCGALHIAVLTRCRI
jgi:hypothetical protein